MSLSKAKKKAIAELRRIFFNAAEEQKKLFYGSVFIEFGITPYKEKRMGYYIDLEKISIDDYKEILRSADLIPSWMVLKEDIDKNLDVVKNHNIKNVDELQKALKNKNKLLDLSKQSGLPEDYLNTLRRAVNAYLPKPNKIKDFPNVADETALTLEKMGVKNTLHLYDRVLSAKDREAFSGETGICKEKIIKLTKLTDLSRIKWVNHTFAYVLMEAGYDTARKVANADYEKLCETVKQLNAERKIYNAHIGVRDMKRCVEGARILPFEIEY